LLKEANYDRPAFIIEVEEPLSGDDAPVVAEWLHAYQAMGLPLEHSFQSTTLTRCYNVELAACFAASVCNILGCDLQEQAVSAGDDEGSQAVKNDFMHALANLDILLAEDPDGEAIESIDADDERLDAARKATAVESCVPFMRAILGESHATMLTLLTLGDGILE